MPKTRLDLTVKAKRLSFQGTKRGAGPWMVLCSTGTAKSNFADLSAYPLWLEKLDLFVGEEAQQLGHSESIALHCILPEQTMIVYVGDSKQQAYIGDQKLRGTRKTAAALEASQAVIRGSMLPIPPEELDRIQLEAIKPFLQDHDRRAVGEVSGDYVKRKILLRDLLSDSTLADLASEALYRYTGGEEPGLLLLRSERLRFGPYIPYLLAEQYKKVTYDSLLMTMPDLHSAKSRNCLLYTSPSPRDS